MTLLLIVLLMSMTFLFSMRTFSQRQEMFTQPRQTARRAMDYLAYYVRGAMDMNQRANYPNSIVVWYGGKTTGGNTPAIQASYNNLTGTELKNSLEAWQAPAPVGSELPPLPYPQQTTAFGDPGTDLVTLAIPINNGMEAGYSTPSVNASTGDVSFNLGCGTDAQNLQLFKDLTGCCDAAGNSGILTLINDTGQWAYFQITGYQNIVSSCPNFVIHITANYGNGLGINPPGGPAIAPPYSIVVGMGYAAFRVKNHQFQQRSGLFDPSAPNSQFNTLLDNVDDLQVAYIYDDGTVTNSVNGTMATTGGVPPQDPQSGLLLATDITHVVGLRLSVTAHSSRIGATSPVTKGFLFRPASEDHAAGAADRYYHYRLTSTVMLRNRTLGY
jgi:hypothetical protein